MLCQLMDASAFIARRHWCTSRMSRVRWLLHLDTYWPEAESSCAARLGGGVPYAPEIGTDLNGRRSAWHHLTSQPRSSLRHSDGPQRSGFTDDIAGSEPSPTQLQGT